jgi:hypothetical protein
MRGICRNGPNPKFSGWTPVPIQICPSPSLPPRSSTVNFRKVPICGGRDGFRYDRRAPGADIAGHKIYNEEADNTVIAAKLPLQTDGWDIHREMSVNSDSIEYQEAQ